jgi:predicted nuclease with TOPRIM domain
MQKTIDRYDTKMNEIQKQFDSLIQINDSQQEKNERLNNELTDLTDLHQIEMSSMKTDLRKLEEKLLYNFNEYWTEMVEKLDKLDTRVSFFLIEFFVF